MIGIHQSQLRLLSEAIGAGAGVRGVAGVVAVAAPLEVPAVVVADGLDLALETGLVDHQLLTPKMIKSTVAVKNPMAIIFVVSIANPLFLQEIADETLEEFLTQVGF